MTPSDWERCHPRPEGWDGVERPVDDDDEAELARIDALIDRIKDEENEK